MSWFGLDSADGLHDSLGVGGSLPLETDCRAIAPQMLSLFPRKGNISRQTIILPRLLLMFNKC